MAKRRKSAWKSARAKIDRWKWCSHTCDVYDRERDYYCGRQTYHSEHGLYVYSNPPVWISPMRSKKKCTYFKHKVDKCYRECTVGRRSGGGKKHRV